MKNRLLYILLLTLLLHGFTQAQNLSDAKNSMKNISANAIKGNMTFLSDDLLEGRKPGTRGFALGSKFIETRFITLGLKPGNGGSFVQKVPLQKATASNESSFTLINGDKKERLTYGKEFALSPYFLARNLTVTAPLVFVGFGVSAPEFNYDDYKNIDTKGKIVVYVNDAPNTFPANERAYYNTADVKYNTAIKHGAVGVINFTIPSKRRLNWDGLVKRYQQGSYKWVSTAGTIANSYPDLKGLVAFNNEYLSQLFTNSPINIQNIAELAAKGKSISFPLNISANITTKTNTTALENNNVMGVLEGSDPTLKNEYVVYTAHLDHLGIGTPVKNDSIYNGAHDDASGLSILLEIIKTYQSLAIKPKRSIIFAGVTGEELGLLGSDYFVNNFPIKGGKIVANLAIDMPFFFHPVLDIVPYGADHSSLGIQTQKAAAILGLKISPDPFPEQVVFIRSDHYSFIKKGIPALFIKSGFMTVPQDTVDRAKADLGWRSTTYHTPQDDMNQAFNFDAATTHAKINFLIGYLVSNETEAPDWNKGDFFGQKLKPKKED